MHEESIDETDDTQVDSIEQLTTLAEQLTPLVEKLTPIITTNKISDTSIIKRRQILTSVIVILIVSVVCFLAYTETIEGSAATGILGAVVGYMFGNK